MSSTGCTQHPQISESRSATKVAVQRAVLLGTVRRIVPEVIVSSACIFSADVHRLQPTDLLPRAVGIPADKKWVYTVALAKQIVCVEEHILAPDFRPGEPVLYR